MHVASLKKSERGALLKKIVMTDVGPAFRNIRAASADYYKYSVGFFLLILLFIPGCKREVAVPQYLIGKWKTAAPKYADRYLKFSEHSVLFGVGDGEEVSHTIEKIVIKQGGDGTAYTVYYRDTEGEIATLTFTYRPDGGGTIQLKNGKETWEKGPPGGTG